MPEGARFNAFAALDGRLFAGSDAGIFRSYDEARSWWPAAEAAMSSGRVVSLATWERRVFAGIADGGMLVSADAGDSWAPSTRFPSRTVRCLLVHQGRLYAGTDAEGVFVLDAAGQVWTPLGQGFPGDAQVFALSAVEDRLFAGLYSTGLYAWNERERRWRKASGVSPLVLAGADGTLVAGHNPGGLYWSADLGATWSRATAGTVGEPTWAPPLGAGELSSDAAVWELASNGELVLAGADAGIFYPEDRGRTWAKARAGLPPGSAGISFLVEERFILAGTVRKTPNGDPVE